MRKRIFYLVPIWIVVDFYFVEASKAFSFSELILWFYWIYDILVFFGLTTVLLFQRKIRRSSELISKLMALMLLSFAPKIIASPVFLLTVFINYATSATYTAWLNLVPLVVAGLTFATLIFGLTYGRHRFKIRKITLLFDDLPSAFDGFTITQFSDFHSGSFDNHPGVIKGLKMITDLKSDLILFTGDLLNSKVEEMKFWRPYFSALTAIHGKFSVLGNHDYRDVPAIKKLYTELGFNLLLNTAVELLNKNQSITLIGVENWGKNSLHKRGNLELAMAGVAPKGFNILMSHDPSHWEAAVLNEPRHIHLTLSGHTHGMQFGFELFGQRWSPIKYIYKQWAGLYSKKCKYLYVNRGFGFIGLKGRIGIWPEITLITLKNTHSKR